MKDPISIDEPLMMREDVALVELEIQLLCHYIGNGVLGLLGHCDMGKRR